MPRISRYLGLAMAGLALCGCAALPEGERDPRDPFETANRSVYRFNDALDRGIGKPVAKAYTNITPDPLETGFSNFFENLTYPTTAANDVLQAKPRPFLQAMARLLVNTTVGIGGLFDQPRSWAYPAETRISARRWDAGMCLRVRTSCCRSSVPIPCAIRSGTPSTCIRRRGTTSTIHGCSTACGASNRSTSVRRCCRQTRCCSAYDYTFIRNAYLQRRKFLISDGSLRDEEVEIYQDSEPATN
jgi:phospholipid-binding lipoprotein MlaA